MGNMNFCAQSPNATLGNTDITWAQAVSNTLDNTITPLLAYLRPDTGGALLPWIYTIVYLFVHIPVVLIRVVRWQAIQYWCLVSTFFSVVLYTQAYVSTRFEVAKVLVWTPLLLVIDAGSMLQVFFLVIEAKKTSGRDEVERCAHCSSQQYPLSRVDSPGSSDLSANYPARTVQAAVVQRQLNDDIRCDSFPPCDHIPPTGLISSRATPAVERDLCWYRDRFNYTALVAALLFIAVLVLQVLGLAKAAQAAKASSGPPMVSWCSPFFQPFGIAAIDGSCNIYQISQSAHKGIGCITLPGLWQQHWLKGTIAGICIELFTELVDLLILSFAHGKMKIFQAVKLKRPWATIFAGVIVLIVTLIYGLNYSLYLPPGVTAKMTVLMDVQGPASYTGTMTSAGLRGTVIGWHDGVFESWRDVYLGSWH